MEYVSKTTLLVLNELPNHILHSRYQSHNIYRTSHKKIIYKEFYPSRGEAQCRFSVCRKAISDFKKLNPSPSCIADLMLYYIETGVSFTAEYGDMWDQYYTTLENNFEKAMEFIYKNGYLEELHPRIDKMLQMSENCGWGFPEVLSDTFYQYYNR